MIFLPIRSKQHERGAFVPMFTARAVSERLINNDATTTALRCARLVLT
jgi:hypothetical protein